MGGTSTSPMLFSPNANLSRAMIVTILHRREGTPAPSGAANPFSDVRAGQWFTDAVLWAAQNGIVSGSGGRFNPNDNVTRQDLAVILMNYADFRNLTLPVSNPNVVFSDQNQIADYARGAVRRCAEAGIIGGRQGSGGSLLFAPRGNATRAEAAAMLHRFLTLI